MIAFSAFAQIKALVIVKEEAQFQHIHRSYLARAKDPLATLYKGRAHRTDVKVVDSLEHLKTIIIETKNDSTLAEFQGAVSASALLVEKEVWHPLPEPVRQRYLQPQFKRDTIPSSELDPLTMAPMQPWGIAAVKAPQAWEMSAKGGQARVVVLDTGIDKDHPALKDNFEQGKDFIGDAQNAAYPFFDGNGHGSHTAGTVAGAELSSGFTGVAPKAKILAGRVCSALGCPNTSIAQGINWAIEQKADAVSMSLGGAFATSAE